MTCGSCGTAVSEGAPFCGKCGAVQATTSTRTSQGSVTTSSPQTPGALEPQTSGKAVASLILGLFGMIFPAAIAAIVLGHISRSEIRKSAGRLKGSGIALAGLILGYLGISFVPILIIAAIAIPNLLRAKIAANESSAIASVRTITTAELAYSTSHESAGYTCSLSDLHDFIDSQLVSGQKYGYAFVLGGCTRQTAGGPNKTFQISAYPISRNQSGVRAFCSDQSASIRSDGTGSPLACLENGTTQLY